MRSYGLTFSASNHAVNLICLNRRQFLMIITIRLSWQAILHCLFWLIDRRRCLFGKLRTEQFAVLKRNANARDTVMYHKKNWKSDIGECGNMKGIWGGEQMPHKALRNSTNSCVILLQLGIKVPVWCVVWWRHIYVGISMVVLWCQLDVSSKNSSQDDVTLQRRFARGFCGCNFVYELT